MNTEILFKFELDELKKNEKRIYLWIEISSVGYRQSSNKLVGRSFQDSVMRSLYNYPHKCIYWDIYDEVTGSSALKHLYDDIIDRISLEKRDLEDIAEGIVSNIKHSCIGGESSEQIIVFDITDPENVDLISPEK